MTDKSNLYPLLGSDYISPKLLQYVTQLHSRSKQDSITHTFTNETTASTDSIQPDIDPNTELTHIDFTETPYINTQRPETQNSLPLDTEILSPDPAREIILRHSQDHKTKQSDNNNHNTSIQEEWIIQNKILPDDKWNSAQKSKTKATNKTQSHNNVYIAHQTKPILKVTPSR